MRYMNNNEYNDLDICLENACNIISLYNGDDIYVVEYILMPDLERDLTDYDLTIKFKIRLKGQEPELYKLSFTTMCAFEALKTQAIIETTRLFYKVKGGWNTRYLKEERLG